MATLPRFSRGLKLVRYGVIAMLLQLALGLFIGFKSVVASDVEGAMSVIEWTQRIFVLHCAATGLMLIGTVMSLGELKRAGVRITELLLAAIGFLIATAAMAWTYHAFSTLVDIMMNFGDRDPGELEGALRSFENVKYAASARSLAYGLGMIFILRMVRRSAFHNDQLGLAEDAGHMSRAMIVMFVGDIFYQLTFGVAGGGVGVRGFVAILLVFAYWIWVHVKLVRFFDNAAHFVNEPHDLPIATGIKVPELADLKPKKPPAAARASRPSMPKPPPLDIQPPPERPSVPSAGAPPPPSAPPPPLQIARPSAPSIGVPVKNEPAAPPSGDGPKFLR